MPPRLLVALIATLSIPALTHAGPELFAAPAVEFVRLAPDGETLALVGRDASGTQHVRVHSIASAEERVAYEIVGTAEIHAAVLALDWIDTDSLLLTIREITNGIGRLEDSRARRKILVLDDVLPGGNGGVVRALRSEGEIVDPLSADPDHILFGVSGSVSYLYRIDVTRLHEANRRLGKTDQIDGGVVSRSSRVEKVDAWVLRWIPGTGGEISAVFVMTEDAELELWRRRASEWETVKSWPTRPEKSRRSRGSDDREVFSASEVPAPQSMADDGRFFAVSEIDGRSALVLHDYETGSSDMLFQHPTAELIDVHISPVRGEPISVSWFEDGVLQQHYFSDRHEEIAWAIQAGGIDVSVDLLDLDQTETTAVAAVMAPSMPGRIVLYDTDRVENRAVAEMLPGVPEGELNAVEVGSVRSGELDIEYYLLRPDLPDPVPLVVYPHGGPFGVRDVRVYDPFVQFLGQQGFAVLQVNFRGSTGFGKDFADAGFGAFGAGMLSDIEAAVGAVLEDPLIDERRVCAVGASYGGYAALMLAARPASVIDCVASHAGVTDLGLLYASYGEDEQSWLGKWILTQDELLLDRERRFERMRDRSPVYLTDRIKVPVLVTHGSDDEVVPVEHGFRMRAAFDETQLEWVLYDGVGHDFDGGAAAYEHATRWGEFLAKHLSARGAPPEGG